jgi:hypothetical protein
MHKQNINDILLGIFQGLIFSALVFLAMLVVAKISSAIGL